MLEIENAGLVIIDIQGKLARIVEDSDILLQKWVSMVKAAKLLNIPIFVAEQNPSKLGSTIDELMIELEGINRYPKNTFSITKDPNIMSDIEKSGRKQLIIMGIETHICVYQSVLELVNNYDVYVLEDLVSSRNSKDKNNAIYAMRSNGANIATLEMALFELIKTADHKHFRAISKLIK